MKTVNCTTPAHKALDCVLLLICVALGCVTMFMLIDYRMPGGDESYQTLCVRNYLESPLGVLVYWIGHLWTQLFGFTILNLRILTSIELILAVSVSTGYLYCKTKNIRLAALTFLLSCILLRAGAFHLYNWDTGTYLFDAISLCLLLSVFSRPTYSKCFFLGISIALMTLGRVTSGIFLPVAIILVYIVQKKGDPSQGQMKDKKVNLNMIIMILLGWLVSFMLMTTIIYKNPFSYFSAYSQQTVVSGHNPINDIHYLWGRLAHMMLGLPFCWFFGIGSVILSIIVIQIKKNLYRYLLVLLWVVFCLLMSYWESQLRLSIDFYLGVDTPVGFSLMLIIPVYALYDREANFSRLCKINLWACLLAVLSYSFGSDAYTERMVTAVVIPVIVSVLWKEKCVWIHKFTKCIIIVSVLSFGTIYYCHNFMIRNYSRNFNESSLPVLSGLRIHEVALQELNDLRPVVERFRNDSVKFLYIGNERSLELVYGLKAGLPFHMYHHSLRNKCDWDKYSDELIGRVEYIIYNRRMIDEEIALILEDVRNEGYTDSNEVGEIVILSRRNSK